MLHLGITASPTMKAAVTEATALSDEVCTPEEFKHAVDAVFAAAYKQAHSPKAERVLGSLSVCFF